jgi:DNA-binding transcriptional MerR regulator
MYTVKQIAKLAGITPRTQHHYDEIGLLKPSSVGANGYRYYDEQALLRLQQILFYREMDLDLTRIKNILDDKNFDLVSALRSHHSALEQAMTRY